MATKVLLTIDDAWLGQSLRLNVAGREPLSVFVESVDVGPSSSAGWVSTYSPADTETATQIYGGSPPLGDMFCSLVVPGSSFSAVNMRCICNQVGPDVARMAIYDYAGFLLGQTNTFPLVNDVIAAPLLAPVSLVAGTGYYFGVWTNSNGALFSTGQAKFVGAGPALSFEAVNIAGVTSLPNDVSASKGNKISTPIYVSAFG